MSAAMAWEVSVQDDWSEPYMASTEVPVEKQCAEPGCTKAAALLRENVGRCVSCHRARNNGRIC